MASQKGLWKGLGALLQDFSDDVADSNSPYQLLPIYKVEPNPDQPRHDFDEAELQEIPDLAPSVADEYARREEIEQIQKILHDVSEPYKEVFMWRVYAELSFKQIAQIFGKTENWACVTYHRARKMIKERLEEKNGENWM